MDTIRQFVQTKALAVLLAVSWCNSAFAVSTLNEDFKSIASNGSELVAIDSASDLFTSDDNGASFTPQAKPAVVASEDFEDVAILGSTAIAVGDVGYIINSSNSGLSWNLSTTDSIAGRLHSVAGRTDSPNPNQWIAVGEDGTNGAIFRSVDNGANWTELSAIVDATFRDVIWTGNRWLAAGFDSFVFDGLVYSSTDGTTWNASTLPSGATSIEAIAADGSGTVIAVGDNGQILRSTDDGLNFVAIAPEFIGGGSLNAVIADSTGTFFVGGDEKLIIEINGTAATTEAPATATAAPVLDFILVSDAPVAIGRFFGTATRTIPFTLLIAPGGSLDYVLTIEETLIGSSYFIETTTDLTADDWAPIAGPSTSGTGGPITFDVSEDVPRRFWRAVEF